MPYIAPGFHFQFGTRTYQKPTPPSPPPEPNPEHRSPLQTRLIAPHTDTTYHLASRANGDLMLWHDEEKRLMRAQLEKTATFCGVKVLNFVLLQNHFHLLIRVPALKSRDLLTDDQLLLRIEVLYGEWIVERLRQALAEPALAVPGTAATHFGGRRLQAGCGLARPDESAQEWAVRELERYRSLMHDLSKFVRLFKHRFSIWYNETHDRFGTLWAERFRSMIVEDSPLTLAAVSAYIDMNPVRAKLVENPVEYPFCGIGEATRGPGMAREGLADLLATEAEKDRVGSRTNLAAGDTGKPGNTPESAETDRAGTPWAVLAERYRKLLWGDRKIGTPTGEAVPMGSDSANSRIEARPSKLSDLPPIHERELVLADFFQWRQQVFLRGAAVGSEAFVDRLFLENRQAFGASREMASQLLCVRGLAKGWSFEGMRVLRAFRLPQDSGENG